MKLLSDMINENSPAAQWGISIILIVNHLKDYSNAVD